MNLAVSNLAWESTDLEKTLELLEKLDIRLIEGILTKIADWDKLTDTMVYEFKDDLKDRNIDIRSIQSIFYGTECRDISSPDKIIEHFNTVINCANSLSVNRIVFGSPNLRKMVLGWEDNLSHIFREVDKLLDGTGIIVLIEPNANIYGGEFFITVEEIVDFIDRNYLKNIATMVDTHNILLESQNPIDIFKIYKKYIKHIHISETGLMPLVNRQFHTDFANMLKSEKYDDVVTYELLPCNNLDKQLELFLEIYKE